VGKTPTVSWGSAWYEHDGKILGCSGKHWVPDPVLFGAVGIPNQNPTSLPCFVHMLCAFMFLVVCFLVLGKECSLDVFEREREGKRSTFGWRWQRVKVESKRVLNEEQHSSTGIQTPRSRPQRVCLSH
jgi:hypothetical protein